MSETGNGNANGKYNAAMMIDAIREAEGNLSHAARILGCSRTTVHKYVNNFVTVREVYEEENDKFIDEVEEQLKKACRRGSIPAIVFALKTKGKHRGYIERQEVDQSGKLQVEYVNDWRRVE